MIYDKNYTLFGNGQIKIKAGENMLVSNFGMKNAYFNSRGDKVDKFLCEGKNEGKAWF